MAADNAQLQPGKKTSGLQGAFETLRQRLQGESAQAQASTHANAPAIAADPFPAAARLTSDTVRIQEEERRKLSLALHDDTAQILGNLVLMMDACLAIAPEDAHQLRRYLNSARATAKDGFRRVQRFCIELRPPMLDDLGLAPTIVWYAERFTTDTDIPVTVNMPERLPKLSAEQETALFRIVQESLQNARKHSKARHIEIRMESLPGVLQLTVRDDGVGFDPEEVEEKVAHGIHIGLAGMRYRAELLKGKLCLSSAQGKGTSILAEIPVAPFQVKDQG